MAQAERVEALVLGSGQGGTALAWDLARSGRRTAVVERKYVGGSCPNIACLPSKNEIWSARIAHVAQEAKHFGTSTAPVSTDMNAVRQRKRDMVEREREALLEKYAAAGTELIMGTGRFSAPKTLEVRLNDGGVRTITADKIYLNLGTHAAIPNIPGLEAAQPMTHIEALELGRLPSHLIVLGGGYVGLEMAQAYRRFGSRVTVIEAGPQLMSREDPDVAQEVQRRLEAEGVEFILAAEAAAVAGRSGELVVVTLRTSSGERKIEGSDLLVAAGRVANTAGVSLEQTGVQLDNRGFIRVNDRLETSAADIWALGECAGSPQFTHVSVDDYRIVWSNMNGGRRSTQDRLIPYCMFTDPPLARVGLSEADCKRQGLKARLATLPMSSVLRTTATDETDGFMKTLVGEDDRVLGFTMIGEDAGEVMAAVQMAMMGGLTYQTLRDAVIAHPTTAEGLGRLFANVPSKSVH